MFPCSFKLPCNYYSCENQLAGDDMDTYRLWSADRPVGPPRVEELTRLPSHCRYFHKIDFVPHLCAATYDTSSKPGLGLV